MENRVGFRLDFKTRACGEFEESCKSWPSLIIHRQWNMAHPVASISGGCCWSSRGSNDSIDGIGLHAKMIPLKDCLQFACTNKCRSMAFEEWHSFKVWISNRARSSKTLINPKIIQAANSEFAQLKLTEAFRAGTELIRIFIINARYPAGGKYVLIFNHLS